MANRFFTTIKLPLFFIAFILVSVTCMGQCVTTDSTLTASVCSGDTFYVGAQAYFQTNTYTDTLTNAGGCDSIVTLNLTVIIPIRQTVNDTICMGDTVSFNGHTYTASGSHADTLTAVTGCDSIVTLRLTVRPILTGSISDSICRGGYFTFNGNNLNVPGIYKDTLTNLQGCDSVVTLTLSFYADVPHNISRSICQGDSYIFYGDTLTYSSTYNDTLVASTGCDSLIVLTLNILPNPLEPYIVGSGDTLTSSAAPAYQWFLDGSAITVDTSGSILAIQGGNYQVQITGPNGCSNISAAYNKNTSGIHGLMGAWDVKLYPNPNKGVFAITFSDKLMRTVQITDALGRVIIADEIVNGTKDFDLTTLPGGVYFVRIKQQEEIRTIRFVLAR